MIAMLPGIPKDLRKLLAFGSGVGIEIGATDLEVVVARVRAGARPGAGPLVMAGFAGGRRRNGAREYAAFLKSAGAGYLSATVLLPRREVIVRQLALPGVAAKDMESAIRLANWTRCIPMATRRSVWGWSPLAYGFVLLGMARRSVISALRGAVQRRGRRGFQLHLFRRGAARGHPPERPAPAEGFLALGRTPAGAVEVYGESPRGRFFPPNSRCRRNAPRCWRFPSCGCRPRPRRCRWSRCSPSRPSIRWKTIFPATHCRTPRRWPGLVPGWRRRRTCCRRSIAAPARARLWCRPRCWRGCCCWRRAACRSIRSIAERRYLAELQSEIARIEPSAVRAAALDRETAHLRARAAMLDAYRSRARADLDALNELTQLVSPPAWTSNIELTRDTARITGEAPQAAPLLKILDSSSLFRNSRFRHGPAQRLGHRRGVPDPHHEGESMSMQVGKLDRRSRARCWRARAAVPAAACGSACLRARTRDGCGATESIPMAETAPGNVRAGGCHGSGQGRRAPTGAGRAGHARKRAAQEATPRPRRRRN